MDEVDVERVKEWEEAFIRYMRTQHAELVNAIEESERLTDETEAQLREAITTFNSTWA
jgi:F-type H+-transporting ATPase subunit alpha